MKRSVEIILHFVFFISATLIVLLLYEFVTRGYEFHSTDPESMQPLKFYLQFDKLRREMFMIIRFTLIYGIVTFYAFYGLFKPLLFDRRRYVLFSAAIIIWIAILVIYRASIMGSFYHPVLLIRDILIPSLFIISGTAFRFVRDWFSDQKQKEVLQKQHLQSQLELVKARINPHFLFNTINNIDVMIKKDPGLASEYLYKLSDTLRYVLYETGAEKISLKKEVDQLEKFIALQRIRTKNPDYINFSLKGTIEDLWIAPMIFITLIENAIKYTRNKKIKDAVDITLEVQGNRLQFYCSNYCGDKVPVPQNGNGLGLDLIRQRLELLYKNNYEIRYGLQDKWYVVDLKINLNDH